MTLKVDKDFVSAVTLAGLANFKIWEKAYRSHADLSLKKDVYERGMRIADSRPHVDSLIRNRTFLFLNEKGGHPTSVSSGQGFSMYRVGHISSAGKIKTFVSVGENTNPENFAVTRLLEDGVRQRTYLIKGSVKPYAVTEAIHNLATLHSHGVARVSEGSQNEIKASLKVIGLTLDNPLDAQNFVDNSLRSIKNQSRFYSTALGEVKSKLACEPYISALEKSSVLRSLMKKMGTHSKLLYTGFAIFALAPQLIGLNQQLQFHKDSSWRQTNAIFKATLGLGASFFCAELFSRKLKRIGWPVALIGGVAGAVGGRKLFDLALKTITPMRP